MTEYDLPASAEQTHEELRRLTRDLLYAFSLANTQLLANPRIIAVANPSAGADWSTTSPANAIWILLAIHTRLVTSATAGNRDVKMAVTLGGSTYQRFAAGTSVGPSIATLLSWHRGGSVNAAMDSNSLITEGLPRVPVLAGSAIGPTTQNLAAGDQWSAISLLVLELTQRSADELHAIVEEIRSGSPRWESFPGLLLGL